MFKTSYRAVIHPDYFTQTFEGVGSTKEEARQSCENQLREVLNNLRQSSKVQVALISFICLDADPVQPVAVKFEPRKGVLAPKAWEPGRGGIRDSGIFRGLMSILSK